jgi:hypothetical protein
MFSTFRRTRRTENRCFQHFAGRDGQKTDVFNVSQGAKGRKQKFSRLTGEQRYITENKRKKLPASYSYQPKSVRANSRKQAGKTADIQKKKNNVIRLSVQF